MPGALIILAVTVITGLLLWAFDKKSRLSHHSHPHKSDSISSDTTSVSESSKEETPDSDHGEFCCGRHAVCEKTSLTPLSTEIVYYDDEELDRFSGKENNQYTNEEENEFRDILLTMLPEDVAGWSRSLQLRNIPLPDAVKDELLMIVEEYRSHNS